MSRSVVGFVFALAVAAGSCDVTLASNASILDRAYDQVYWSRIPNTYDRTRIARLTDPLYSGYRVIEIDVHPLLQPIPPGAPLSNSLISFPVREPRGVLPIPNNCRQGQSGDLHLCLRDVREWVRQNPDQEPITIIIDLKRDWTDWDGESRPIINSGGGVAFLDEFVALRFNQVIEQELSEVLFRPMDLDAFHRRVATRWVPYLGNGIRLGVERQGWPRVSDLRGKVLVLLKGGDSELARPTLWAYLASTSWWGSAFACPAAVVPSNFDPRSFAEIVNLSGRMNAQVVCGTVEGTAGWSSRTVAAEEHRQLAILSDSVDGTETTGMHLAIAHKASFIRRDGPSSNRYFLNGGRTGSVPIAGYISARNSSGGWTWMGRTGAFDNAAVQTHNTPGANTLWKFTDQRQLVSVSDERFCLDIKDSHNGVAAGDWVHMYRCDGGRSERWKLNDVGQLYNDHDGLCLEAARISGQWFRVDTCVSNAHPDFPWQQFGFVWP